jgi:hypothetical protein
MGTRGPVPARSDQRRRRNKPAVTVVTAAAGTPPQRPRIPRADPEWHPLAKDMYNSLRRSGQSAFFEPSDWQTARLAAEATSRLLLADKLSAMLMAAIDGMWQRLLMTEGDRRRLGIELEKPRADEDAEAAVSVLDDFRRRSS